MKTLTLNNIINRLTECKESGNGDLEVFISLPTEDEKSSLPRIPLTFQLFCELINVVIHT